MAISVWLLNAHQFRKYLNRFLCRWCCWFISRSLWQSILDNSFKTCLHTVYSLHINSARRVCVCILSDYYLIAYEYSISSFVSAFSKRAKINMILHMAWLGFIVIIFSHNWQPRLYVPHQSSNIFILTNVSVNACTR